MGNGFQIDATKPLQEKPLTARDHSFLGLTNEVRDAKLSLMVDSSHERNLSLSATNSQSAPTRYPGRRTGRRQSNTSDNSHSTRQPSQGNSQPQDNSQWSRNRSTNLVADPNRRGDVWASISLFEENGDFSGKLRPDDIAPKTNAKIQAALREFVNYHNYRVSGQNNVDLCPMGFHLPQPRPNACSCKRRHIQAKAWPPAVRAAEIMHMMGQQKPYLQITTTANSDIPQRR